MTTSGQVKSSAGFSFDVANEGEESEIVRENNGGLVLRRGFATFLTCSPFSGCSFGDSLTCGNLKVNRKFTASGGISRVYSGAAVDDLLSRKQNSISTGSLAISDIANLQTSLDARQSLLSDRDGTGVTLRDGSVLRRIFRCEWRSGGRSDQHWGSDRSRKRLTEGGWVGVAGLDLSQAGRAYELE